MGKCSKAAKSEVLFVFEDLGLDLGTTNLDNLSFRDLIGYLDERKRTLNLKSLKLGFKSECSKSPEEWKRSIASGPDFEVAPNVLIENKCNLGNYLITPTMFRRDILSRFLKRDPHHYKEWVLAVLKVRWTRWVWNLIKEFKIRVIQTEGTPQTVKARIKRLLHLWVRGTAPSPADRGYLPLDPLDPVLPASSSVFVSRGAFGGKGPPLGSSNLADSGIFLSSGYLGNEINREN